MNIARFLHRSAAVWPDLPAVASGHRVVADFRTLGLRVAQLAGGMRDRLGLQSGDRVALIMRNGPHYVEAMEAAWHGGFVAVPINAKLHPREFAYILDHSGARAVFVTDDLLEAAAAAVADLEAPPRLVLVDSPEHAALYGEPMPMAAVQPRDTAWLFYTSGTTGRPKGAMLSHQVLQAFMLSYFTDVDSPGPGDSIIHWSPMSHGSGINMLPNVAAGAVQVIPEGGHGDPASVFDLIGRWKGASLFAAPTMVWRLVDHAERVPVDTANLRTIVYGGGPMYLADCKRALAAFGYKLTQIYGQGESPMTITALSRAMHADVGHPRYEQRLASAGVAQAVCEVRVCDADDRDLPVGEVGEILVRGDVVMTGYWRNPEATAATLRGGWLHTGDMGAFDEDGFLTLKDRSKDMIISGGSNIYPREVEEVLLRHPDVAEVSVVGRPHPEWGEEVVAFVVRRPGAAAAAGELDRLCLDHIARFKRPKDYRFVDALPKNNYGKVLKTALREALAAAPQE
ncbi:AMP-binding protein [Stella sp.]|uniref:AMP-binding protein n=1 Tax=Stella sp. TaxID=2912054 RepID=UPI0035B27654